MSNFGNLLGFTFSVGAMLAATPISAYLRGKTSFIRKIRQISNDKDFSDQVFKTLLGGATASLVVGIVTKSSILTIISIGAGGFLGFKSAHQSKRNRDLDLDLRLRLASGTFIDLVGICIRSGMSIRSSIIESAQKNSSEIAQVWQPISNDSSAEFPFLKLLSEIAELNKTNVMGRVARTLLISQERGTPIQQTLQGLASEIRSETRRQLLEIAAKKDLAMMVPVVFGILPSITAIALYPAFVSLSIM